MRNLSDRLINLLIQARWAVLAFLFGVTGLACYFVAGLTFENAIEDWFRDDDPSLVAYDAFTDTFQADEIVIVAIFTDSVFEDRVLDVVDAITTQAAQLDHVHRVQSITNSDLIDRYTDFRDSEYHESLLASPLLSGTLVNPSGTAAAVVIHFARSGNTLDGKRVFVERLETLVATATATSRLDYAITGGAVLNKVSQTVGNRDMSVVVPTMLLVILVISYAVFRQPSYTLLPMLVVVLALIWTLGLMAALGWPMTMISTVLIPLVLAIGVADSIHLLAHFRERREHGDASLVAIRTSFNKVLMPCWLTTATTSVGLLSLVVSEIEPIRQFAYTAAFGVTAAFLISMTILPVALSLLPDRNRRVRSGVPLNAVLGAIEQAGRRAPKGITISSAIVVLLFGWLALQVDVEVDPLSWLPKDNSFRASSERVDAELGGTLTLEFLVQGEEDTFREPKTLRQLSGFQQWVETETWSTRSVSLATLVKEAAWIARDQGIDGYTLPRTRMLTDLLLDGLDDSRELASWVNGDYSIARISVRLPRSDSNSVIARLPDIRAQAKEQLGSAGLDVELTGIAAMMSGMQRYIVDSQLKSFLLALVTITVMMILLLRSVPLGMAAMVPNIVPIIVAMGAMYLLGIHLNPGTVMIAAVAIGVVVDDSVHFMTAFSRASKDGHDVDGAIQSALADVGRPVLITSTLLAAGFAVLLFGNFLPSRQIGGIVAIVVIVALLADLILLPAVLRYLRLRSPRP